MAVGLAAGTGSAHAATATCQTPTQFGGSPAGLTVQRLDPGQSVDSPGKDQTMQGGLPGQNPVTRLVMQADGNLVVYLLKDDGSQGPAIWSSGTWGNPGAYAVSQTDGNFVVYKQGGGTSTGGALWSSQTWGGNNSARMLADGQLYVPTVNGIGWTSGTGEVGSQYCPETSVQPGQDPTALGYVNRGQWAQSPNAWLVMQYDGNLVVYRKRDSAAIWSSGTAGSGGTVAAMQNDGNLVISKPYSPDVWATGTYGNPGARAVFQTDSNLVVYRKDGAALWATGTWQAANQ
ncbi:hypothetical protein E6W39_34235 [Kitasatospora acidiphila]|uniref:Bulb-type lectin domain-containing protein n=1 Tax=Kitasatospora acidiphila TaxID=2567942 RepID=A0A540WBF9_9ACTN|nr:hypothetical protein [Kitasatospora acidiphila]TQF06346.1 hypothetical protein E6W39_34235 [Kitasatospora acidiphila]